MAAKKFLRLLNGIASEVLGIQVSAGVTNAGDVAVLDDTGRFDQSLMPNGIGADSATITASEALATGDFVNIYSNAGTANVRKADGTTVNKIAHGYVLAAVAANGAALVYFDDTNSQLTGQTAGDIFLSTSAPGKTQSAIPSGAGFVSQKLGSALSATSAHVNIQTPYVLAS